MKTESNIAAKMSKEAAEALGTGPGAATLGRQERALVAHLEAAAHRRTRFGPWRAILLGSAVTMAATAGVFSVFYNPSLAFWVGEVGHVGAEGESLRAPETASLPLVFEGGTTITLKRGAHGKVTRARSREARFVIREGGLVADVRHARRIKWVVEGGPYSVVVTGTRFSVAWDPHRHKLDVAVNRGSVRVRGPGIDGVGMALRQGEHLEAEAHSSTFVVRASTDVGGAADPVDDLTEEDVMEEDTAILADPPAAEPKDGEAPADRPGLRSDDSATRCRGGGRWLVLSEMGHHAQAYRAAERCGVLDDTQSLPLAKLWQLGTVARYARKPSHATAILKSVRVRFPKSDEAQLAAFLLGWTAMELSGDGDRAAFWFRLYLHDYGTGVMREEAMGRLIDAYAKAGKAEKSARAAFEYLAEYPEGAFARQARATRQP